MAHRDVAVFFFWFIGRTIILIAFVIKFRELGKIRNACTFPCLFIVRLWILVYWFYFLVYKDLVPHIKIVYHLNSTNWWRSKDEPFFTNCSILNAFFCWFWWFFTLVVGVYICIAFVVISGRSIISLLRGRRWEAFSQWVWIFFVLGETLYYYFAGVTKYQERKLPKKFMSNQKE